MNYYKEDFVFSKLSRKRQNLKNSKTNRMKNDFDIRIISENRKSECEQNKTASHLGLDSILRTQNDERGLFVSFSRILTKQPN